MVPTAKEVDGDFREAPQVPVATGDSLPAIGCDHILVLRPTTEDRFPGKTYSLTASGSLDVRPYGNAVFFRPILLPVDDIGSLHAAFCRVTEGVDGAGFIVRGTVWEGADPRSITRRKTGRKTRRRGNVVIKGRPRGLDDASRRWGVLDMDKIPNIFGIDPRHEPERAIAFVRSLLPVALRTVRLSWQWSSSTCVRGADDRQLSDGVAPPTLGAHLRFWADRSMAEAEMRAMLKGINAYVTERLVELGAQVIHGVRYIDSATATYSQPIYTLRPQFTGGAVDPFPGATRYGLTVDGEPEVDIDLLLVELPQAASKLSHKTAEQRAEGRRIRAAAIVAVRERNSNVIEFTPGLRGQNARLLAGKPSGAKPKKDAIWNHRQRMYIAKGIENNKMTYRVRALSDMREVILDLKKSAPGWESGIPKGMRDHVLFAAACLLANLDPGGLFTGILEWAEDLVDPIWFEEEWKERGDRAVMERAVQASLGFGNVWNGQAVDPRYPDPNKNELISLLAINEEQMIRLELKALITEAVRSHNRRRAKGIPTAEEFRTQQATSEKHQKPWADVGVSESTWRRVKRDARTMKLNQVTGYTRRGTQRKRQGWSVEKWLTVVTTVRSIRETESSKRKAEEATRAHRDRVERLALAAGWVWNEDAVPWDAPEACWLPPPGASSSPPWETPQPRRRPRIPAVYQMMPYDAEMIDFPMGRQRAKMPATTSAPVNVVDVIHLAPRGWRSDRMRKVA